MVAVLPILVVAYLCQMSLGHTVSQRQLGSASLNCSCSGASATPAVAAAVLSAASN